MKKRILALLLSVCMALGLTACGGSEAEIEAGNVVLEERLNEDFVYFASDTEFELNSTLSDVDFKVFGQTVYYPKEQTIVTYSTEDRSKMADTFTWTDAPGEWFFERVSYGKSGEVYALVQIGTGASTQTASGMGAAYYLCQFDAERNLVFAAELSGYLEKNGQSTGEEIASCKLEVGSDGRIYFSNNGIVQVFDGEGNYVDEVNFGRDGNAEVLDLQSDGNKNLYVLYKDNSTECQYVAEIDTEKCAVKALQQTIGLTGIGTTEKEGVLLGFNGAMVYTYDRTAMRLTELLHWTECGVSSASVYLVKELADGQLFAAGNPTWGGVDTYLIKSMQVDSAEASESGKIDIRVASLINAGSDIRAAAAEFNRSHEKYNIVIDVYGEDDRDEGLARLEAELAAGRGPDIMDMGFGKVQSKVENMYLEDLTLYLAESEVLSEGEFLNVALEEYNVDGILAAIPQKLYMSTMVGSSDVLGTKSGWTMKEYLEFIEGQGGAEIFPEGTHCRNIFWPLLRMNEEFFVDRETNTCNFDNDIFRKFVEVGAAYPLDYDRIEKVTESRYIRMRDQEAVLTDVAIFHFMNLQTYNIVLGDAVNVIGFPVEDGVGVWVYTENAYGINAMSEHKDAAWEFLEYFLQRIDNSEIRSSYFPTYLPNLEKMAEEYQNLENAGSFRYSQYGDKYDYHVPTSEEIDEYLWMLENARIGSTDVWLLNLMLEELDHYYSGEMTLDELIVTLEVKGAAYLEESR